MGIGLASFQQLTGINVIMFYSTNLFDVAFATKGAAIINVANFVATVGGMGLLSIAGRKTLMLICQTILIISLFGMWWFSTVAH